MAYYQIANDCLTLANWREDLDLNILSSMVDGGASSDEDELQLILLNKLKEVEDESIMMSKVLDVIIYLQSAPDAILRFFKHSSKLQGYLFPHKKVISPTMNFFSLREIRCTILKIIYSKNMFS